MAINDPKVEVRDRLANNWDNSNTVISEDPLIHTGWFNHSQSGRAQVSVIAPDETPYQGGVTGFSGISAAGEGLKVMIGTLTVACWAHDEMYDSLASGEYKQLAWDMSEEVRRIIDSDVFALTDFEWVTWNGRREVVDTDADPILYRYQSPVDYLYLHDTGTL